MALRHGARALASRRTIQGLLQSEPRRLITSVSPLNLSSVEQHRKFSKDTKSESILKNVASLYDEDEPSAAAAAETNAAAAETNAAPVQKKLPKKSAPNNLNKDESILELLDKLPSTTLTFSDVNLMFDKICRLCSTDPPISDQNLSIILHDDRVSHLARHLGDLPLKQTKMLNTPALIQTLKLTRNAAHDAPLVLTMEDKVFDMIPRLSIGMLTRVIELHAADQTSDKRKLILMEAVNRVSQRYAEISNPRDILSLMYAARRINGSLLDKLEDRSLDLVEQMSLKQMYRMLYLLGQQQRRNSPLIRALTYHMLKRPLEVSALTGVQLANLLYALARLSMYDVKLLEVVSEAIKQCPDLPDTVVGSCINSVGILRFRDEALLALLADKLLAAEQPDTAQLASLLRTCSLLGVLPGGLAARLGEVTAQLQGGLDAAGWLDVVYSLTMLGHLNKDTAASVCNDDFAKKVLAASPAGSATYLTLKLLNIAFSAKHTLPPGQSGVSMSVTMDPSQLSVRPDSNLKRSVKRALSSSLDLKKYVRENVTSDTCFNIDLELLVDTRGNLQQLSSPDADMCHKVAVQLLDFADLTLGDVQPTGFQKMIQQHLSAQKYVVLQIFHHEFLKLENVVQQLNYIETKLKAQVTNSS